VNINGRGRVGCTDLNHHSNNNAQFRSLDEIQLFPLKQVSARGFCTVDEVGFVRLLGGKEQLLLDAKDAQELHAICLKKSDPQRQIDAHDPVFCNTGVLVTHRICDHAQNPIDMETRHRAQREKQIANANALFMAIGNEKGGAGEDGSRPDYGHRYIEFG